MGDKSLDQPPTPLGFLRRVVLGTAHPAVQAPAPQPPPAIVPEVRTPRPIAPAPVPFAARPFVAIPSPPPAQTPYQRLVPMANSLAPENGFLPSQGVPLPPFSSISQVTPFHRVEITVENHQQQQIPVVPAQEPPPKKVENQGIAGKVEGAHSESGPQAPENIQVEGKQSAVNGDEVPGPSVECEEEDQTTLAFEDRLKKKTKRKQEEIRGLLQGAESFGVGKADIMASANTDSREESSPRERILRERRPPPPPATPPQSSQSKQPVAREKDSPVSKELKLTKEFSSKESSPKDASPRKVPLGAAMRRDTTSEGKGKPAPSPPPLSRTDPDQGKLKKEKEKEKEQVIPIAMDSPKKTPLVPVLVPPAKKKKLSSKDLKLLLEDTSSALTTVNIKVSNVIFFFSPSSILSSPLPLPSPLYHRIL